MDILPGLFHEYVENLLPQDGSISYRYPFYDLTESTQLFNRLMAEVTWKQEQISMYGKIHDIPRLSAWYGDHGKDYSYSGIKMSAQPWNDVLNEIKHKVDAHVGVKFNSVLVNLYRTGEDYVAWHSDDEPELGQHPVIASVSLGATRKFRLRHRYHKELPTVDIDLMNGSLLVMSGESQRYWHHCLSKSSKVITARINLTFRQINLRSKQD